MSAGASAGRRISVLVVDDDVDSAELLQLLLTARGLHVVVARSCQGAMEATENEDFDVVMSDIRLPDGDGRELFSRIRRDGPIAGIAISGFEGEESVRRSREAGFDEYFVKPIDVEALLAAVHRLVGKV